MKRLLLLCALLCFSSSVMALELYQGNEETNAIDVTTTPVEEVKVSTTKQTVSITTPSNNIRKIGLNVEGLLARADIRMDYELLSSDLWSGLLSAHINPHPDHQKETGNIGVFGGGRLYFKERNKGFFSQMKAGLNYEASQPHLGVELGAGYTQEWHKDIYYELGIMGYRSYSDKNPDSRVYLMVNIMVGFDYKLLNI